MQLGATRAKISAEERARRLAESLCFRCGRKGHWARSCRVRPGARERQAPAPGEGARVAPPPKPSTLLGVAGGDGLETPGVSRLGGSRAPHLFLPVVLCPAPGRECHLRALVDSGASASFLDWTFARAQGLGAQSLPSPLPVQTIDGRPLLSGAVTHVTAPLRLQTQGHTEWLRFYLADIPHFPMVLGMPWLAKHDPLISWEEQRVSFPSAFCRLHCCAQTAAGGRGVPVRACATGAEEQQAEPSPLAPGLPVEYADFASVFDEKEAERLPPHRAYDCAINLIPGQPLPKGKLYAMSESELLELRQFLDTNLRKGFIRPSSSPLGAPSFFIPKKNGQKRLVHAYSDLNKITIRDAYPIPLVGEMLERLGTAKWFTKLDLRGAYNLVRIREGDEWKTAFLTRYGAFEYTVMSFGLANAPAVFSRFMQDLFWEFLDSDLLIYFDDLLIHTDLDLAHHRTVVREILGRLRQHGLYAKLDKCLFDRTSLDFLGYRISREGIRMDPAKVQAVLDWGEPRSKKDVQKFLGFVNFYRRFLPGFSTLTAPLSDLLKKTNAPFQWGGAAHEVFVRLKALFTSQPLLQHVSFQKPFVVHADASDLAVGAVLLQPSPGGEGLLPCAFHSRKLSTAERNYPIWEKELLAIKSALETWRHLLEGASFPVEVRTDHKNLEFLRSARATSQRQVRWSQFFSRFNLKLCYIKASDNQLADALSRQPQFQDRGAPPSPPPILPLRALVVSAEEDSWLQLIRAAQEKDAFVQRVRAELALQHGDCGSSSLSLRDGLLFHDGRLFVPAGELRARVLRQCHDACTAGHFGVSKTVYAVTRDFWWPRVFGDVRAYVRSCQTCQRAKHCPGKPAGLLQPLPTPSGPWSLVSMDFITDLPVSQGHTAILVVVDLFSKMAHFVPCPGLPSARETAELFVAHIFRLHGWPQGVVSDRGGQFIAHFWKELMALLEVELRQSSAHHPQTDGQTERTNATLEQYLRCYVSFQQQDWAKFLPLAEFAYNNSYHNSTQQTPFFVNLGLHPRAFPTAVPPSRVPEAARFLEERQALHAVLREQLDLAKASYKQAADRRRQPGESLAVGDWVWLSTRFFPSRGACKKLSPRRTGPFQIVSQINPVAFKLALPPSLRIHPVFHRALLSPVVGGSPYQPRSDPPPPIVVDGEEEYEVEQILDSRVAADGGVHYLIHWKGYGVEDRSWEPVQNIHAPDLLQQFHQRARQPPAVALGGGLGEEDTVVGEATDTEDISSADESAGLEANIPIDSNVAAPAPAFPKGLGEDVLTHANRQVLQTPAGSSDKNSSDDSTEAETSHALVDARLRRLAKRQAPPRPARRSARLAGKGLKHRAADPDL